MKHFIKILITQYLEDSIENYEWQELEKIAFRFMRQHKIKDLDAFIFTMIENDILRENLFSIFKKSLQKKKNNLKKSAA